MSRSSIYSIVVCVISLLANSGLYASSLKLKGHFVQGGLVFGLTESVVNVRYKDRDIVLDSKGGFIMGFGRDEKPQVELEWLDSEGVWYSSVIEIEQRQYEIQHIKGVPSKTVNPPQNVSDRIREESLSVRSARANLSDIDSYRDPFKMPLSGVITGVYGSQRTYNGVPKRPHYGIDIAAPEGSAVYPPASGRVSLVHDDMYYSGGTLIIDHGQGLSSTFIHLSKILVGEGDWVGPEEAVALVGSTGRSTGPHLDWRMNWLDVRIDPQLMLAPKTSLTIKASDP